MRFITSSAPSSLAVVAGAFRFTRSALSLSDPLPNRLSSLVLTLVSDGKRDRPRREKTAPPLHPPGTRWATEFSLSQRPLSGGADRAQACGFRPKCSAAVGQRQAVRPARLLEQRTEDVPDERVESWRQRSVGLG